MSEYVGSRQYVVDMLAADHGPGVEEWVKRIEGNAVAPWRERLELVHRNVCGFTIRDANGVRCDCGYLNLTEGVLDSEHGRRPDSRSV